MMDLQQATELKASLMWGGVVEELDRKIFLLTNELMKCSSEELRDIQFTIKCYQSLKKLPDDIIEREE